MSRKFKGDIKMENEKVIAKGSGHELVKHQVGDHCNYEVRRRASAPVHPIDVKSIS